MMQIPLSRFGPAALVAAGLAFNVSAADVLTAVKVAQPPKLSAGAADVAWAKAKPLSVKLAGGQHFKDGGTSVLLKAAYSGDMLFMLVQYADPTQSVRRFPYQKQADGSWKKLVDANDKGGDDNVYYEDKFAILWNIGNSIKGFSDQGCMAACHAGRSRQALWQQVHRRRRRARRHLAHEIDPHRLHRTDRRPVPRSTRASTRTSRPRPAARATRKRAAVTTISSWSTASPSS